MRRFFRPEFTSKVTDFFDNMSRTYDTTHTRRLTERLLDVAKLQPGEHVLDIATGTGETAVRAAKQVGPEGQVIGIDISSEMIAQAKQKAERQQVKNVHFEYAKAGNLPFRREHFDVILCLSSIQYIPNLEQAMKHWGTLLKPNGRLIVQDISENAFVTAHILKTIAKQFGITVMPNQALTGTEDQFRSLLRNAGVSENIQIIQYDDSRYISYDTIRGSWHHVLKHPFFTPLLELPSEALQQAEAQYYQALKNLETEHGIWNEQISFYCVGEKAPTAEPATRHQHVPTIS